MMQKTPLAIAVMISGATFLGLFVYLSVLVYGGHRQVHHLQAVDPDLTAKMMEAGPLVTWSFMIHHTSGEWR
jgi:hypothetical protein